MFNTAQSSIIFDILENNNVIFSGVIPYDLFELTYHEFCRNTNRSIRFTIESRTYILDMSFWNEGKYLETKNELWLEQNALKDQKQWYEDQQVALTTENALMDLLQNSDTIEQATREQILSELARAGELQYQQMLVDQSILSEEQAQKLNDEQYRIDMLRSRTVTQIAVDPTYSIDALGSEVGQTGDVQRQIAAVMRSNPEVTKLIIDSNLALWVTSYEIMDVIAVQALQYKEIADKLKEVLPEDNLLLQSLNKLLN